MKYIDKLDLWVEKNFLNNFLIKYKYVLIFSIILGILINAIDIFTFKFGIDAEEYAIQNSPETYFNQQRYGSYLLYYLFPFLRYHIVSQILGIIALVFAVLLSIIKLNISNLNRFLFVILTITYSSLCFLQYFYFQSAYNFISMLLVVIVFIAAHKKSILAYIISIILLVIGISSYQSNMAVFLTILMINVILQYLSDKDYKYAVKYILKFTVILLISIILYYILILILSSSINSYHASFISYKAENIFNTLKHITFELVRTMLSINDFSNHTANFTGTFIFIIILLVYWFNKNLKTADKLFFTALIALLVMSIFSINILLGSMISIRANIPHAFYISSSILIFSVLINNKISKYISIIVSIFVIIFHFNYIVKYNTTSILNYEDDKIFSSILLNNIYTKYPEIYESKYSLTFTGQMHNMNRHPLIISKEVIGESPYTWDYGRPYRMISFLKLMGLPSNINLGSTSNDMKPFIENMPMWPDENCIQLYDNKTIIVKLR